MLLLPLLFSSFTSSSLSSYTVSTRLRSHNDVVLTYFTCLLHSNSVHIEYWPVCNAKLITLFHSTLVNTEHKWQVLIVFTSFAFTLWSRVLRSVQCKEHHVPQCCFYSTIVSLYWHLSHCLLHSNSVHIEYWNGQCQAHYSVSHCSSEYWA